MKKIIVLAMMMCMAAQGYSQVIYWGTRIYASPSVVNTATVTEGALGMASIVSNALLKSQQMKAEKELQMRYTADKAKAQEKWPTQFESAENKYQAEEWGKALQEYSTMAHINDDFNHELGDQLYLVNRIEECNEKAGVKQSQPGPLNNKKAVKSDYSMYTVDIENPVSRIKKKQNNATMVRLCRNDKETRIEFEYRNTYYGSVGLGVKGDTYIKGKKSGKLKLRGIENITIAPARTLIPYSDQVLRFALVFPPLAEDEETFDFKEPSSEWQFLDIYCK